MNAILDAVFCNFEVADLKSLKLSAIRLGSSIDLKMSLHL